MASPDYVRAKDKSTGHKVTILRAQLDDGYQELKQDAVDEHGAPLAPEYAERTTTKSPSNQSGQSATTKKEAS